MNFKKGIIRILSAVLIFFLILVAWYIIQSLPVISGYGAKNLCSAVYLQHRNATNVIREDLSDFPISLGTYTLNEKDSSVTGSVFGFARQKAIYRKGLGATLISDYNETTLRAQHFNMPALINIDPDTIGWPNGDKLPDTLPEEIDKPALNNVLELFFKAPDPAKTRAVVVVYDGQLVAEKYADGFERHTLMPGWSVSKSITAALTGILVNKERLNTDKAVPIKEWQSTDKKQITLKQLLQQTSGLDYNENYAGPSEATTMLFKRGDMAGYVTKLPLKNKPGTVFNYSSGNANIVSRIIRETVGEKNYHAFPYDSLLHPVGMYSTILEPDASGTFVGSSYTYATARDFARFGLLCYNNGKWNNRQILPENWVKESVKPSTADNLKHYGYFFWLNGFDKKNKSVHWYPDVPADMYFADGYGGQDIYIIPSKKLVVVRLGLHTIDENKLLKEVIAVIK